MQRINKLHVFEPVERVCLLKLPANAFVLRMPDGAPRAHDPPFNRRDKRHTEEIFRHRIRNRGPRHAAIRGMKNRSFVPDNPSGSLSFEGDCIERRSGS